MAAKDVPAVPIHPDEVGIFAAHLLAECDLSEHNGAKYILNRPEDITGEQLVGHKFVDTLLDSGFRGPGQSRTVFGSIKYAAKTIWEGKCSTATTSKEVLELAAPERTPAEVLRSLLDV
ncbi:hypothetical protein BDV39DRAFT_211681 [Aspergillus sergii]|uniref:NmrA-like domain-containing protein n=1 Tax=Aspergillus sergii TaxID=1034303 RepID=A0A5N6WIN5_9EURO|nr:hypothetical protein BDV39DRAFT_211681 [Aspergillus sergii]